MQRRRHRRRPWLISEGIWQVAAMFKELIDQDYRMLDAAGVLAMDPDEAPPGVAVRMEYSTFCQGWIPHLPPRDPPFVAVLARGDDPPMPAAPFLCHGALATKTARLVRTPQAGPS
jgi:hypothetical protein